MLQACKGNTTAPSQHIAVGAVQPVPSQNVRVCWTTGWEQAFMGLATGNIKCMLKFLWDWQAYLLTKETDT